MFSLIGKGGIRVALTSRLAALPGGRQEIDRRRAHHVGQHIPQPMRDFINLHNEKE
jgi:hypothetical protein